MAGRDPAPPVARPVQSGDVSMFETQDVSVPQARSQRGDVEIPALTLVDGMTPARLVDRGKLSTELDRLEAMYLDELMVLRDPVEGLQAFLEKRAVSWTHA